MSQPYLGQIMMFAGNFAINGWALCQGQLLPIQQYTALFSILGTTYGGNGTTNFALPDFRGRVPISMGQGLGLSYYVIGQQAGTETVTLLNSEIPAHNHLLSVSSASATASDPTNAIPAQINTGTPRAPNYIAAYGTAATGTAAATALSITGGSQPHSNIQPYLTINFIIALVGVYPSRN